MKILFILPRAPYPPTNGAAIGILNRLRGLSERGHELEAIAFCDRSQTHETILAPLRQYCRLHLISADLSNSWTGLLRNCLQPQPYLMQKYAHHGYRKTLQNLLQVSSPDLVQIEHFQLAPYLKTVRRYSSAPAVLREHCVENVFYSRQARGVPTPSRLYASLQAVKMLAYKKKYLPQFDLCLAVSESDAAMLRSAAPRATIAVAGVEVDLDYFQPLASPPEDENLILWAGDLRIRPNWDGLLWFCRNCWSFIAQNHPARLCVAGHLPMAASARSQLPASAHVTGFVEDLRPLMAQAAIIVIPLLAGGGIKVKLLNALAMAKAVVTTPCGLEGTLARPGCELECADNPRSFADHCLALLRDSGRRQQLARTGRRFIETYHTREKILDQFESQYARLRPSARAFALQA